jgi:predicted membrane chloride channel (bestrophin family)
LNIPISKFLLAIGLGLFIGAVSGVLLDKLFGLHLLGANLLKEALLLEFYIIKIEIQITPASLIGLVVSGYLVIKKG